MALAHQNLAVAVGAAKDHARTVLQQFCGDKLASVKPLVEAALGVARRTPEQA